MSIIKKYFLCLLFILLFSPQAFSKIIELKVKAGGAILNKSKLEQIEGESTFNAPFRSGPSTHGDAMFGLGLNLDVPILCEIEGKFDYLPIERVIEASVSGEVIEILQIQELFYKKRMGTLGREGEEQLQALAGLGFTFKISEPEDAADEKDDFFSMGFGLNVGGAYFKWQRPGQVLSNEEFGAYAGSKLQLNIWKFKNTLRVAVVGIPEFDEKGAKNKAKNEASNAAEEQINQEVDENGIPIENNQDAQDDSAWGDFASANFYWNISERLYIEALNEDTLSIDGMGLGPELEATIRQLPDFTEWKVTLGISATFGK